jgi:hypothetical protein
MAVSRYKFFDDVWNEDFLHLQKGFPNVSLPEYFGSIDSFSYQIPISRSYRPDLIAKDFYGNALLYWVLVYANNFSNSPEDFAPNLIIKVPKFERLMSAI